jgi:hypothetical protein
VSEGEWASIAPDVLPPVEEVGPVAVSAPNGDTVPTSSPVISGQTAESIGVEQPLPGYPVTG